MKNEKAWSIFVIPFCLFTKGQLWHLFWRFFLISQQQIIRVIFYVLVVQTRTEKCWAGKCSIKNIMFMCSSIWITVQQSLLMLDTFLSWCCFRVYERVWESLWLWSKYVQNLNRLCFCCHSIIIAILAWYWLCLAWERAMLFKNPRFCPPAEPQ